MKEKLPLTYNILNIKILETSVLKSGTWILLHQATAIPPHLIFIHNNHYFSLSVRGTRIDEPLIGLLQSIERKKTPCVGFKLKDLYKNNINEIAHRLFRFYKTPEAGSVTCLFPIRETLTETYSCDFTKCNYIFELFAELNNHNLLQDSVAFFLTDQIKNNTLVLPTYSQDEIDSCIQNLKDKHVVERD